MSFELTALVWSRSRSSGTARLVMLALADYAGRDGHSWPSVRLLAGKTGLSERAVRTALRQLEALGEVVTRPGGGRAKASDYWITLAVVGRQNGLGEMADAAPETRHLLPPNQLRTSQNAEPVKEPVSSPPPGPLRTRRRSGNHAEDDETVTSTKTRRRRPRQPSR